jgi:uncharacterized membrane-anchored protein
MTPRDRVVMLLAGGLVGILAFLVIADFAVAIVEKRAPDAGVIGLLKMAITGVVGIIAGYIAGKNTDK